MDKINFGSLHNYYCHSILYHQKNIELQERIQKMATYFIKYPKLTPLWDFLTKKAPFPVLTFLFIISLVYNVKRTYGYSLSGILKYGLFNFKTFFKK